MFTFFCVIFAIGFWIYLAITGDPSYDDPPYIPYGPEFDEIQYRKFDKD